MKKLVTLSLVVMLLFGVVGGAIASPVDQEIPLKAGETLRLNPIKEFTEELHQINELRIERLNLVLQVVEKNDTILDLYLIALEEGNQEAIQAVKELRLQIRDLNQQITNITESNKQEKTAFREAIKENDLQSASHHINQIILNIQEINNLVNQKISLLNEIITLLN